jgi:endoglucanase Acf2
MRKLSTILLLILCSWSTAFAQVVPVGNGSYTSSFPGTDEAGRNTFPGGTPQLSGVAATKPVPTNDWWSNLIKEDHGGQAFNYPLSFRSVPEGLVINYTIPQSSSSTEYRQPMSDVKAIVVGVDGLNAARSTASDYSDWTVTMNWNSNGQNFNATMGMGMPFVYFSKGNSELAKISVGFNPSGARASGNKLIIQNNMNGSDFVVFGPAGSSWSGSGGVFTSNLAGKNYWSMAMVPPGMDVNTFIANYERFAYVFPGDTKVNWNYNEPTSMLRTTFSVTPDVKEGSNNTVLLGLLPHQWGNLGSGSPQPDLASYQTVRGELRMLGANSFAVENRFSGVLPTLPDLGKYSEGFELTALNEKIERIKGDGLPAWTDSYNEGQNMNRLIQAARIADQIGNIAARDQLLNTVQERLENWLTAEGGEVAFLFYYNSDWNALLGYPAGHSQDSNLNDHHFHWGYFIHAAAALEQFKPGWASQWGPMIDLLIRDAGNPSRDDPMFPFLRNFSPYAGHAWANGFATEPFGNDQESTSESMQFNASLIHWGTITNNKAIRDLGIYLYTTEVTAIQEYWFDIHDRTFQPEYAHEMVARIWSAGYDNGTWWTSDIAASYGIQLYPIHGGALYMGYEPDYVSEVWEGMKAKTEVLQNVQNPNLWYDTYWSFLSFLDPAEALRLYNDYTERDVKTGMSDAQTYHWLHTMNAMGQVANEITADYPIAAVFNHGGEKTYVAHNYGSSDITVNFSDGTSLFVPAGEMVTNKDSGLQISLSAPGVEEEPCSSGINSNFTIAANVAGDQISMVEFYRNGDLVATDNTAPFELPQSFSSDGVYAYVAKAYNGQNFENSNVLKVTVGLGNQTPYSTPHTVPGTMEAGHYDKGDNGIAYYDVDPNVYEADLRSEDDVDAATSSSQGSSIGWITAGEWLEYSLEAEAGEYSIRFNIASNEHEGGQSGTFAAELNCETVGSVSSTPLTGDWENYEAVTMEGVNIASGAHVLRISFTSGVYNLGRITFTRTGDYTGSDNQAPAVSISSPANNASFIAPANISITANASDADGTVSLVEFFANGNKIGEDNSAPYSFNWTGVAEGTYALTAKATDDTGASTTSAEVNVSVESDGGGGSGFPVPGTVQAEDYSSMNGIELEGTTDDGGGQNVGWIDAGDWMDYEVNVATAGTYTVNFRVASAGGGGALELRSDGQTLAAESIPATGGWQNWTTISASINLNAGTQTLRVYAASGGWNLNWISFSIDETNEAPPVSLTAPAAGASFTAPATIHISADAADPDGSISAVAFYHGEQLLATDNSSPYSYSWTGVSPGSYSITARATDNSGAVTTSSAVAISVEAAPSGTDITDLGGSITVQYNDSPAGEGFNNLIDNNTQTKYLTFNSSVWLQYQAPGSYIVDSYTITSANDAPERDPLSWTLQGSADGSSWTTIDSRSGEDFPSRYQTRTFSFSNSQGYTYFRLNLNNNSGTMLQLAEIQLFGTEDAGSGGSGFPVPGTVQAEDYSSMNGIELEGTSDDGGGQNVGWIDAGDWMDYEVNVASTGTYTVDFRVASAGGGGALELQQAGQTLAAESIPATGGWQNWTTISASINLNAGTQTLRVYAAPGGWNLNWMEFTASAGSGGGACSFNASTGDYTAEVSGDSENPTITFVPSRSGVGSSTVILYYGSSATDALPGYAVSANQPFSITAKQGQTIYFYYTYNVPEGGERNTSSSRHSFTVGNCGASARMSNQDSFAKESSFNGAQDQADFTLYPNPVQHDLHIPAAQALKGARINILDASGRSVYQGSISSEKLDVSALNPGVYSISIQQGNLRIHKRFIKE